MRASIWLSSLTVAAMTAMSIWPGRDVHSQAAQPAEMDTSLFRRIAHDQTPVVVAIVTRAHVDASRDEAEWFERFFKRPLPSTPHVERQIGAGFFISPDGDILTTNHLVAEAETIEVRLFGLETTTRRASLIGSDPVTDSAVLRLDHTPPGLPIATLGDSDLLRPGDWVMAIGNPFRLAHSVTVGVVSAEKRSFETSEGHWQTLIQMDTSINPGSSGGPLLNARGEVVGMAMATLEDGIGGAIGIGFAVPINSVKAVLPALRAGVVRRGQLGIQLRHAPLTGDDADALGLPRATGALITSVARGSFSERAGLHAGDVIVEIGGSPVLDADDLLTRVAALTPGSILRLTLMRDGKPCTVSVEVEALIASPVHRTRAGEPPDFGLTLADTVSSSNPSRTPVARGPVVQSIEEDGPADRAGLLKGDLIRRVNRRNVLSPADVMRELQHIDIGRPAFLLVWRDGHEALIELRQD